MPKCLHCSAKGKPGQHLCELAQTLPPVPSCPCCQGQQAALQEMNSVSHWEATNEQRMKCVFLDTWKKTLTEAQGHFAKVFVQVSDFFALHLGLFPSCTMTSKHQQHSRVLLNILTSLPPESTTSISCWLKKLPQRPL